MGILFFSSKIGGEKGRVLVFSRMLDGGNFAQATNNGLSRIRNGPIWVERLKAHFLGQFLETSYRSLSA